MMSMRLSRAACLASILMVCIGSDQLTKWLAVRYLEHTISLSFFHDTLRLSYIENSEGFLGLLGGLPEDFRSLLLTWGVAGLIIPGLIIVLCSKTLHRSTAVPAILVLGGGLSNLIDRLVNDGQVIDFLNVGLGSFRTGIFNLADAWILIGSFVLGAIWFQRKNDGMNVQGRGSGMGSRQ